MKKTQPIGVYDSGVGGLTVLQQLQTLLPHEQFIYFGDTINLPYGNKTKAQIVEFSRNIIRWFTDTKNVKLVVAACNTSSALALDELSKQCDVPLIGTIRPVLKLLLAEPRYQAIGIIATAACAESKMHEIMFKENGYQGTVQAIGCPEFVSFIEAGDCTSDALREKAQEYLSHFSGFSFDTLLYGCTHYPLIRKIIEPLLPSTVHTIDPAITIAEEVKTLLTTHNALNDTPHPTEFYCSGDPLHFEAKLHTLTSLHTTHVHYQEVHASSIPSR